MRILFLANSHLNCNSGWHISSIANSFASMGVDCVVCVPNKEDILPTEDDAAFSVVNVELLLNTFGEKAPDLIYVWTPREGNRKTLARILEKHSIPYVVHFEDNEFHLTQVAFQMNDRDFANWRVRDGATLSVPNHLSDPSVIGNLVSNAAGVTALIQELLAIVPEAATSMVFWPGFDESLPWAMPPDLEYKKQIGIPEGAFVIAYTGNLHAANASEIRSLYLAVALLNRRGLRVHLVRTGQDHAQLSDHGETLLRSCSTELGFVQRSDLPRVLSIADVLVQPGHPDDFNVYRFPSKVPEFLASGKAVILPKCNIGNHLENGKEAIVLPNCGALEIVRTLETLLPDNERRKIIGKAGADFAARNLRWNIAASRLLPWLRFLLEEPST